jgi:hypothetical protein
LFIIFIGFVCFFFYNFYLLVSLISLELIVLTLVFFISTYLINSGHLYGFFVFLVTSVCMGGYGISLLISLSRETGVSFFLV